MILQAPPSEAGLIDPGGSVDLSSRAPHGGVLRVWGEVQMQQGGAAGVLTVRSTWGETQLDMLTMATALAEGIEVGPRLRFDISAPIGALLPTTWAFYAHEDRCNS